VRDDRLQICCVHPSGRDCLAVSQDGEGLRDLPRFLQEMADVDYGESAAAEPFDDREEALGIVFGKGAGRFVKDDDSGT
jgi:hypothetical protein